MNNNDDTKNDTSQPGIPIMGRSATPLFINLNPRESECVICDVVIADCRQGLPMYEGEVMPVDYDGPWAGFDCCVECAEAYKVGGPAAVDARRKR